MMLHGLDLYDIGV